jgi:hypothetical protein
MGRNFDWYGNSSTITAHLRHVGSASELDVGDLISFGRNGEQHVSMVLEPGSDPLLWSFGHPGSPNTYRLSADKREKHFLKLGLPPHVPTKIEKIREKKGYWAWVQWKLGEGDWRGYGKANEKVRPDVPKRIPLDWWKLYAKFLLNRKKANKSGVLNP